MLLLSSPAFAIFNANHHCEFLKVCFVSKKGPNGQTILTIYSNFRGWVAFGIGTNMDNSNIYLAIPSTQSKSLPQRGQIFNLPYGRYSKIKPVESLNPSTEAAPLAFGFARYRDGFRALHVFTFVIKGDPKSTKFIWAGSDKPIYDGTKHTDAGSWHGKFLGERKGQFSSIWAFFGLRR